VWVQGTTVETAVRRYGSKDVRWSSQGMLRLTPDAMHRLFQPTLDRIKQAIAHVVEQPAVRGIVPWRGFYPYIHDGRSLRPVKNMGGVDQNSPYLSPGNLHAEGKGDKAEGRRVERKRGREKGG